MSPIYPGFTGCTNQVQWDGKRDFGWKTPFKARSTYMPEFVRALDDEKKKIYFAAREKAEASEKIVALRKEMNALEAKERSSREDRYKLMMRMRRTIREEILPIFEG